MKLFSDTAAEFVPAVERVFGARPRVLDGSRAVLLGDLKLQLEAGERELWLIEPPRRTRAPARLRAGPRLDRGSAAKGQAGGRR